MGASRVQGRKGFQALRGQMGVRRKQRLQGENEVFSQEDSNPSQMAPWAYTQIHTAFLTRSWTHLTETLSSFIPGHLRG